MIGKKLARIVNIARSDQSPADFLSGAEFVGYGSAAGQAVTAETCRNIATAYRCINTISDDVAKLPLQTFVSRGIGQIERVRPDPRLENISWLLEVSPNRWMVPLVFKKAVVMWLLTYGAAYIWQPVRRPGLRRELFILPSNITRPDFDDDGQLWYVVEAPGKPQYRYPDVEVLSLLINSTDGVSGRSVISYARDTMGRQLANYDTQTKIAGKGLNPSAALFLSGDVEKEARNKVRSVYEQTMRDSGLAVFDGKVLKFEQITMKPTDAQFLEGIAENDAQIANFFSFPLHKLNQGKQSYESNEQQNLDYLNSTLDPYLVQWEQAAAVKWLSEQEQNYTYFRFNRDALLRMDAKTRAETIEKRIFSGELTPNEGRQIDDLPGFPGGDRHYIPSNMAVLNESGDLVAANGGATNAPTK